MAQWLNGSMAQWLNGSMAQWLKVCLLALLGTIATEAYSFDAAPFTGDTKENRDIYIDKDAKGRLFRHKLTYSEREGYQRHKEFVSDETLRDIEAEGFTIRVVPEEKPVPTGEQAIIKSKTPIVSCPVPSNFWVFGWLGGQAYGNRICMNTSRNGKNTFTLSFEFKTNNYHGNRSHTPIIPFFKNVTHGWGAFFGDNSASPDACASGASYNTQIEAWARLPGPYPNGCFDPNAPGFTGYNGYPNVLNCAPHWQAKTFITNSCGNELEDGKWYRMTLHANTNKIVYYKIEKKLPNGQWDTQNPHTPAKVLQVDNASEVWPKDPVPLDIFAQGIAVLATDGNGSNWSIQFSNFNYGWM